MFIRSTKLVYLDSQMCYILMQMSNYIVIPTIIIIIKHCQRACSNCSAARLLQNLTLNIKTISNVNSIASCRSFICVVKVLMQIRD